MVCYTRYVITIFKDTNTLNEDSSNQAINALEKLVEESSGKISIEIATVMETELLKDSNKNEVRLKKAAGYIYSYEVAVLGESRLGYSILGSEEDNKSYKELLIILFGDKQNYKSNDKRDALHIHTAIRSGGRYFITYDKKLLRRSVDIQARFNSLIICIPEECLKLVLMRIDALKETNHW